MELKDLTPEQLNELKNAFDSAILTLIKEAKDELLFIKTESETLRKQERELWEKQRLAVYPESSVIMEQRMVINKKIAELQNKILNQENIVFCLDNGGIFSAITDKKGKEHTKIPDFRSVSTNQIYFDLETILTDKQPVYVPNIDEENFRRRGYVFDAIRLDKDSYILAIKKHSEEEHTDYVLVTLDQLVLISDYYYTKAKAILLKEAKDKNKRSEEYWDKLPEEKRERFLNQKNLYHSLPVKIKKEITQENYEALDWLEKEKIYKFYKRYGSKKIVSKLGDTQMWTSFHSMYERFIDPTAVPPKKGYGNALVFEYWYEFREMMKYKINDIEIQRDDLSEMRKIALETSYGESNTSDVLKQEFGILVKRQNGDKINPMEIDQIKNSFASVQNTFGNLKNIAAKQNIKISHTGVRYCFASKAIGMYVPSMGTIAVSDKYGDVQFKMTLAHETGHFIDNYIGELNKKSYASNDYESTAGRIAFMFRDNMNKPKSRQNNYVNSTQECFARAMEQYYGIEAFGDDAGIAFSYVPLDKPRPFFVADDFIGKDAYYNKLKPLIIQFFTENEDIFKYTVDVNETNEPVAIGTENENTKNITDAIEVLTVLMELSTETQKQELQTKIAGLKSVINSSSSNPTEKEIDKQIEGYDKTQKEKSEIPIMDEETYLTLNGASRQDIGEPALHKNKGNNSDKTWSKLVNNQAKKDVELIEKRQQLREEYKQKLANGELRPPTRIEKLIAIANGHDDNESVQAARRILQKQGVDWVNYGLNNSNIMANGGETKLLAPNGKPSNLTPEQYKLVRTPEFKQWFGDWINQPETASKVVDENGEPLVVYHGTNYEFTLFDLEETRRGGLGTGFYFTQNLYKASAYGSIVLSVFINAKTPIYVFGSNRESDLRDILNLTTLSTEKEVRNAILQRGYDSVLVKRKGMFSEIAIFDNKNIKLADGTNTTFDNNYADIRFEYGGEINTNTDVKSELINRIPFLKDYNIFNHPRDKKRLEAQRVVFNENVKVMMGDDILNFPQYNVSSEIIYYPHTVGENTFYNFIIKNTFHAMQPKELDDLTFRVFLMAKKQLEEKLSYNKEIMFKTSDGIPKAELDNIINEMNGVLFEIEQFTEKHNINLFQNGGEIENIGMEQEIGELKSLIEKELGLPVSIRINPLTSSLRGYVTYTPKKTGGDWVNFDYDLVRKFKKGKEGVEPNPNFFTKERIDYYFGIGIYDRPKKVILKKNPLKKLPSTIGDVYVPLNKRTKNYFIGWTTDLGRGKSFITGKKRTGSGGWGYAPNVNYSLQQLTLDNLKRYANGSSDTDFITLGDSTRVSIKDAKNLINNQFSNGGEINIDNDLYQEWKELVNMSATELEKFKNTPEGKKAGLTKTKAKQLGISSVQESSEWILKMKKTDVKNWTPAMWKWAAKQVAFIKRMSGIKGNLFDENNKKTRKHTSLLIWGHNPFKLKKLKKGGKTKKVHDYCCAMLYFNNPKLSDIHSKIIESDVYIDEKDKSFGLENEPHTTLLYGLHQEVADEHVFDAIKKHNIPNQITLENVSLFENEKYDVLKFDVNEPVLHKINKDLAKYPHTNSYHDYHPHCTIAYLKKGKGKKYCKMFNDLKITVIPQKIVYSKTDGSKLTKPL